MAKAEIKPLDGELFFKGVAAAVAVLAFFVQPVLKFANPDHLVGGAAILSMGIFWVFSDLARDSMSKATFIGMAAGLLGYLGIAWTMMDASKQSTINDERCATVQADMLAPNPVRGDSADVFQALGCRPQGVQDYALPKTGRHVKPPTAQ